MPERPYTQHNEYIETSYPTLGVLKELHAAGKLNASQEQFMKPKKPPVEFYDTQPDRYEVRNLAESPEHKKLIAQFSKRLDDWMVETKDKGGIAEPKEEVA